MSVKAREEAFLPHSNRGGGQKLIGDIWPCLRDGERRPQEWENWREKKGREGGEGKGKLFALAKHSVRLSQDASKSPLRR